MERPLTPWGFLSSAAIWLQVSCSRTVGSKLEPVSADLFPKSVNGTACSLSYRVKIACWADVSCCSLV
jgi:hypothetical protein